MFYHEYSAPPVLGGYIQCFWALEHDYRDSFHTHEHLWADTHVEVIFSFGEPYYQLVEGQRKYLPTSFVIGPFKKELLLYSDGRTGFVAVRFHPWGFAAFGRRPMTELINAIFPAEDVLDGVPVLSPPYVTGEVVTQLEILGGWLGRILEGRSGGPLYVPAIAGKLCALNGILRIGDLADC